MAVLILVADDKGNIVRVERRDDPDFLARLGTTYRTGEIAVKGTTFHVVADTTIFQFNEVFVAIKESPRLNDQQRADALALFNGFVPGDTFAVTAERPIIRQGGDVPGASPPLFIVFVDP